MNQDPVASYTQDLLVSAGDSLLGGQLTSLDPDPDDPAFYSLIGEPIPGLTLWQDGSWSFDPGDPAYRALTPGQRQTLTIAYRVDDRVAPLPPPLPAGVIRVGGSGASFASIQAALDAAPAGATIAIAPGTYNENLTISRSVTLLGANQGVPGHELRGPESIIRGRVLVQESAGTMTLDGLWLAPAATSWGGTNLRIEAADSSVLHSIITSGRPDGGYAYPSFFSYAEQRARIEVKDNLFNGILDSIARPTVLRIFGSDEAVIEGNTFSFPGSGGSAIIGTSHRFGQLTIANNLLNGGGAAFFYYNQPLWDGRLDQLTFQNNALINLLGQGISFGEKAPVGSARITGNIIATNPNPQVDPHFVNISVIDPGTTGSNLDISGNAITHPWDQSRRFVGVVPTDPNQSDAEDSAISAFRLTVLADGAPAMTSALPLARPIDEGRFAVSLYASGLGFPSSMTTLEDGSLLVAVTEGDPGNRSPFGTTNSRLVRLPDADHNGVADTSQTLATLPGFVTSVRRVGDLVFALSTGRSSQQPALTIWRTGRATGNPSTDPLQLAGRLDFAFPPDFGHTTYALAARISPGQPELTELYFNLGAQLDSRSTDPSLRVGLSAAAGTLFTAAEMPADSIQRVLVKDSGSAIEVSPPRTIATGLRNAAGMVFDEAGNLLLQDNGIDRDPSGLSSSTSGGFAADELNRIEAGEIGITVPHFGFAGSYVESSSGQLIHPSAGDRAPLVAFLPQSGRRSQGAVEIATAPIGFDADFAGTVFTAFFGKFGVGTAANDLNPIVVAQPQTGGYANFIQDRVLGNPSGLLATPDALFLADFSRAGIFFGSSAGTPADQLGAIYRITPQQSSALVGVPRVENILSAGATIGWSTDQDAITGLELWGGAIPAEAPRLTTLVPAAAGSGFSASVNLDGLDSATTYSYRVRVGKSQAMGTFRTAEGPLPPLLSSLPFGTAASDIGFAVATASDGSILLGGETASAWDGRVNAGQTDGFLVKLDAQGARTWTAWYGSNQVDPLRKISVASDGTIAVVGGTLGNLDGNISAGSSDGYVGKIGADGTKLRTRLIGGTSWDYGHGVATGPDGSIYAVGFSASTTLEGQQKTSSGPDLFLTKLSADGDKLWTRRWGNGLQDYGINVVVAADGSVYVTGFTQKQVNGTLDYDALLSRYDPNGNRLWTQILATPNDDFGEDLTIGLDGSIIVAVSSDGDFGGHANSGGRDVGLAAFRPDGTRMWTRLIGSAGTEEARSLITGSDGSLTMTGRTTGNLGGQTNSGGDDGFVTRFSAAGQVLWTRLVGSGGNDVAWGVAQLPGGDFAVAGEVEGSLPGSSGAGGRDAFVQRLGTDGTQMLVIPDGRTIRFDPLRYIASFPDLIQAFGANTAAGTWHYLNWGFNEGRRIDAFDPAQYLAGNDALIARFGSDTAAATRHYISEGFAAGTPADAFDENRYLASNPGLIPTYRSRPADAAQHYLSSGRFNGSSRTAFDPLRYIASHPDLINAFGASATSGSWHYVNWGSTEGRRIDAFDPAQYLAGNDALIARFGSDTTAATRHYINEGFAAGTPADAFDEFRYLASNPDLITNYRSRPAEAAQQYLSSGRFNGSSRTAFDPLQYIASYPDLIQAFGANAFAGSWHYVLWGSSEGRQSDRFDEVGYLATHPELIGSDPSALAAHFISTSAASLA